MICPAPTPGAPLTAAPSGATLSVSTMSGATWRSSCAMTPTCVRPSLRGANPSTPAAAAASE